MRKTTALHPVGSGLAVFYLDLLLLLLLLYCHFCNNYCHYYSSLLTLLPLQHNRSYENITLYIISSLLLLLLDADGEKYRFNAKNTLRKFRCVIRRPRHIIHATATATTPTNTHPPKTIAHPQNLSQPTPPHTTLHLTVRKQQRPSLSPWIC